MCDDRRRSSRQRHRLEPHKQKVKTQAFERSVSVEVDFSSTHSTGDACVQQQVGSRCQGRVLVLCLGQTRPAGAAGWLSNDRWILTGDFFFPPVPVFLAAIRSTIYCSSVSSVVGAMSLYNCEILQSQPNLPAARRHISRCLTGVLQD